MCVTSAPLNALALSPNANYLAATTEEYDQATRQLSNGLTPLWELPGPREIAHLPPVGALSFSPDRNYLAGVVDQTTGIWNLATPRYRPHAGIPILRVGCWVA